MKKTIAIIPARSGSKGLPDKNIKTLNGKPLLWYSVNAAIKSGMFDEIMVSTDSEEYAKIAQSCGAKVPFLRSEANSGDASGTFDAVREVLEHYRKAGREFENVTILQPTSPFRSGEDIKRAFNLFKEKDAKAVVSVCKAEHPIFWYNTIDENLSMEKFNESVKNAARRQDAQDYYRLNGAIYIVDVNVVISKKSLYENDCYAYIMEEKNSIDIDTIEDFEYAEFLINKRKMKND